MMRSRLAAAFFALCLWMPAALAADGPMAAIDALNAAHPGQSGAHVLDTGRESLLARAWLADNARSTIEAQYFIWSTDNIGILAAEALLRAADRGVKVRVIVDDLPLKAPDKSLLALALHPNIDIKIYNPRSSVGTPLPRRVMNALVDFRGFNQRMHNKIYIVDGKVAITGGRNMAAEYFDYNQEYNFRDRDALVLGDAVGAMRASFDAYWASPIAVAVEERFNGLGLLKKNVRVDDQEVQEIYRRLHEHAASRERFTPETRAAIRAVPESFDKVAASIAWGRVDFIADRPGKNDNRLSLGGGGATANALAELAQGAKERITIQSPYLVLSDQATEIMREARARGVRVRILTNSLASTDNLMAFSGYRNQRERLLKMGLEVFEIRPDAAVMRELMQQFPHTGNDPIFAIHAKTMVVDGKAVFIGTYNFDLRSQNLNTETGVAIYSEAIASAVERTIENEMLAANSWSATEDPDRHASAMRRAKVRAMQAAPMKPLL